VTTSTAVVATTTTTTTLTTTASSATTTIAAAAAASAAAAGGTPPPFFVPTATSAYTLQQQQQQQQQQQLPWHVYAGAYNAPFLGPLPPGFPSPYALASPPRSQAGDASASVAAAAGSSPSPFTPPFAGFRPPAAWNTLAIPSFARGFQAPGFYPPYQIATNSSSGATEGTPANSAKASKGRSLLLPRPPSFPAEKGREQPPHFRRLPVERPLATKACDKVTVAIPGVVPDFYLSLGPSNPRQLQSGERHGAGAYVVPAGGEHGDGDAAAALVKCNGKGADQEKKQLLLAVDLKTGGEKRRGMVSSSDAAGAAADCSSLESGSVLDGEELPYKEFELGRRNMAAGKKEHPELQHDLKNPWNEEMVRFLFESYEAIHKKLNNEANGHGGHGNSKYHKKWSPILRLMKEKFGREFTKHQCQSKYYKVRRECAKYTLLYKKKVRSHPSMAGRELQRPRFYEIWQDFGSKTGKKNPQISPLILELCKSDAEEVSLEMMQQQHEEAEEEEEEEEAGSEEGFCEKTEEEAEDLCTPTSERSQQSKFSAVQHLPRERMIQRELLPGIETDSMLKEKRGILNMSEASSAAANTTHGSEHQHASGDGEIAALDENSRKNGEGKLWNEEDEGARRGGGEHGIGVDLNAVVDRGDRGDYSPTATPSSSPNVVIEKQQQQQKLGDMNCGSDPALGMITETPCIKSVKRKETPSEKGEEAASLYTSKEQQQQQRQQPSRPGFGLAKRIKKVDEFQLMRDMQILLCTQLKACERREESIQLRGEAMGEMLKQHVEHMQKWGTSMEQARLQQSRLLECVITKLESLMHQVASLQSGPPSPATPK